MLRIVFILLFTVNCAAKTKVAVIDTGFDSKYKNDVELCKDGHKDFTSDKDPFVDSNRQKHGTNIAGLIAKYAKTNYCLVIIKYHKDDTSGETNLVRSNKAIRWAIDQGVDIINYSGGGYGAYNGERNLVYEALNKGIIFVAAAGNEGTNLNKTAYYPAMYDKRVIVVGCVDSNKERCQFRTDAGEKIGASNHGDMVDASIVGIKQTALGITLSGTSQSTAIMTGLVVRARKETKRNVAGQRRK